MGDIFALSGTIVDAAGSVVSEIMVAVVDEDEMDEDDLIAVGPTDSEGRFALSFVTSEFRQDTLEFESTPDIKIIVSTMIDGSYKAVFERQFPDLDWDWTGGGEVDLGRIALEGVDLDDPTPLEDVEAFPGIGRRALRLDVDDDLVRDCLAEVAPLVEHLTGWSGLLDGLKIDVTDSMSEYTLRAHFAHEGIDPDSLEADITAFVSDYAQNPSAALYDVESHTMVVHAGVSEQFSLAGFKLVCAHELIHVGQFKHTRGLKAYQLAQQQWAVANSALAFSEEGRARTAYMTEIEGYASYIEYEFLAKRYYRMMLQSYHDTFCQRMLRGLFMDSVDDAKEGNEAKGAQYVEGIERFKKRQLGDIPVRFDLKVANLHGGPEILATLDD